MARDRKGTDAAETQTHLGRVMDAAGERELRQWCVEQAIRLGPNVNVIEDARRVYDFVTNAPKA